MNLPEDPPEAYEDYFMSPDQCRVSQLHDLMCEGFPFANLSKEDKKLLMDDVDAAMAECEIELRRESELRYLQKHKNML